MKLIRPDSYVNASVINSNGFNLEDYNNTNKAKYNTSHISVNSYSLDKHPDSTGTFDDGLVFQFPCKNYTHLTYYCRTSTPDLDTCNVKLFRMEPSS